MHSGGHLQIPPVYVQSHASQFRCKTLITKPRRYSLTFMLNPVKYDTKLFKMIITSCNTYRFFHELKKRKVGFQMGATLSNNACCLLCKSRVIIKNKYILHTIMKNICCHTTIHNIIKYILVRKGYWLIVKLSKRNRGYKCKHAMAGRYGKN